MRFTAHACAAVLALSVTCAHAAGFDFSKVCWNGDIAGSGTCTGTLVANTGATTTGEACTKDNHTKLIWSLQTVSAINWTNANATGAGSPIDTHNTATRCGFNSGWRVPTHSELLSIAHSGTSNPAIDIAYFPGTGFIYWSSDTSAFDSCVADSYLALLIRLTPPHRYFHPSASPAPPPPPPRSPPPATKRRRATGSSSPATRRRRHRPRSRPARTTAR